MITERQIKRIRRYCREPIEKIKGYYEAVSSDNEFDCHHLNGLTYTMAELKKMNMYYRRPASELEFVDRHNHRSSKVLHHEQPFIDNRLYGSGDKAPNWRGNKAKDSAKYRRALRLFKAGLISEEELAPLRKLSQQETKLRHIEKSKRTNAR